MSQKHRPPSAIVLLGAQRFDPTLGDAFAELRVEGPVATVTAGWQERESEDQDLDYHLAGRTVNLRLHQRADDVFARDKELNEAHREKQSALRHKQDFYRIRLEHGLDAHHVVFQRKAPAAILAEEREASLAAIRQLDDYHLAQCERLHREFDQKYRPLERPAVDRHRREIAAILRGAGGICIAGGHVATLLNRLRLFGIADLIDGHAVFAWSAGAMAVSDRVVLFHDSPPQGPGVAEVLDGGLGLCPGVVPLPQPETRLKLEDPERVSLMARRFAPAHCIALPARSRITFRDGRPQSAFGTVELFTNGAYAPAEASEGASPSVH